ncbi:MAG: Bug family tripartite tricarboxylate transporter substrate binding protein [Hydrogenophaga sp.]|uniref:Bug family tripartite tricarboxylate transporter substrate binding protein n=1 Tax=Hydrogenophaga sp. TaxID=1904254 RepID=UPI0040368E23
MKNFFAHCIPVLTLALSTALSISTACAQSFPTRPIKIVVPFAAGGSSDALARAIASGMAEGLKVPVVVDNKPGAGGVLAMESVLLAPADGYTLLFATNGTHSIGPALYPNRKFDPNKVFTPVAWMHNLPNVLLSSSKLPFRNVSELIAYAKSHPGELNFASAGNGSASHLYGEYFKKSAGIDIVHVPYKGGSMAVPDLISGQVALILETMPNALSQVRGGHVRALGLTTAKRSSSAPEIPTLAESGLPGFDAATWSGLVAAAGTPETLVRQLNAEANRISQDPKYVAQLKTLGVEPVIATPESMREHIHKDLAKWVDIVKINKIRVDP